MIIYQNLIVVELGHANGTEIVAVFLSSFIFIFACGFPSDVLLKKELRCRHIAFAIE